LIGAYFLNSVGKRRVLVMPRMIVAMIALHVAFGIYSCSGDKGTNPDRTLNTSTHIASNYRWETNDYIVGEVKWRLLSISDEGLNFSYIVEFKNISTDKEYTVTVQRLILQDKDGFQLGEAVANAPSITISPQTIRTYQGSELVDITDISVANTISSLNVWLGWRWKEVEPVVRVLDLGSNRPPTPPLG
jgi:hypothetical protein